MSDEKNLDALLAKHASAVFDSTVTSAHIADERLAIDPPPAWTPEELAHLSRCLECRSILAERERDRPPAKVVELDTFRRHIFPLVAAAAAVVFVFFFYVGDPELRSKGSTGTLSAELTMVATSSSGARRDVRSGDLLSLSDRLGFKYGNPDGEFRTITVLGFDGETIHWYYPERAGEKAQPIERTTAIGTRLPFDIALQGDHRPGKLKIVAGFDADPKALASMIERGEAPKNIQIVEVEILGGPK